MLSAAAVLLSLAAVRGVDLPGIELADAPRDLQQVAQALRVNDELAHIAPKSVGPADAKAATFNLYGNYTLTQIPPPMAFQNFIPGVRVQILNKQIFFAPVPAEVAGWMTSNPKRYKDEFTGPAAHLLSFLSETLKDHKVPDVDATFAIGDFCFGFARNQPEVWGPRHGAAVVPGEPPA